MLSDIGQYVFEVAEDANKIEVRRAVEEIFKVRVRAVNIVHMRGKMRRMGRTQGRTSDWKKAVVSLEPGFRIELFQGV
jgi:large subunit ribosomal protein L23